MRREPTQLLDISDDFGQLYWPRANDLPQIAPRFFVPLLEDKPQNPILEALKLEDINSNLPPRLFQPHLLPQELAALSLNAGQIIGQNTETNVEEIWKNALIRRHGIRVGFIFNHSVSSFTNMVIIAEWFTVLGSITAHTLKQSIVHPIPVRARPYGLCICSLLVSWFCSYPYKS